MKLVAAPLVAQNDSIHIIKTSNVEILGMRGTMERASRPVDFLRCACVRDPMYPFSTKYLRNVRSAGYGYCTCLNMAGLLRLA